MSSKLAIRLLKNANGLSNQVLFSTSSVKFTEKQDRKPTYIPEYHSYNQYSYFDLEKEMVKYRQSQPRPDVPSVPQDANLKKQEIHKKQQNEKK